MAEGKRLALLIGNQSFLEGSGFTPLRGPHNDVDALAAVLADRDRGGFEVAPPLKDATRSAMLDAIEALLRRAGREDTVLIHYSGHGKPDAKGRLHFAAADSHAERLRTTALRAAELHEMASESACRAIILLLDCCYSGAIGEAMQAGLRGEIADQAQQELRRTARDATGLFILTSSTGWQTSEEVEREVDGRVMGRFTRAVLDRLEAPPPPGRAGEIRFSHLAEHVEGAFPGQDARRFQVDSVGDPLIARAPLRETEAERREKRLLGWVRDGKVPEFVYAPCFEAIHGSGSPALVTLVARLLDAPGMTPGAFAAAVRDALPGDVPPVWGFNEAMAPAPAPVRAPPMPAAPPVGGVNEAMTPPRERPMPAPMQAAPPSRRRFVLALVLVVVVAVLASGSYLLSTGFSSDRAVEESESTAKASSQPPALPLPPGDAAARPTAAADPALLEPGPHGLLPKIGLEGQSSIRAYGRAFDRADPRPRIGLVLGGVGLNAAIAEEAIRRLPPTTALAFNPYAPRLEPLLAQARAQGMETLVALPLEPTNYPLDSPGERVLLTGLPAHDNLDRLEWALSRFQGYVGAIGALGPLRGERFAAIPERLGAVQDALRFRGLLYVDPRPGAPQPTRAWGRTIDVVIDEPATRAEIEAKLGTLERLARERGSAVGYAGEPSPALVDQLTAWAGQVEGRGFALAPITALLRRPEEPPRQR